MCGTAYLLVQLKTRNEINPEALPFVKPVPRKFGL